MMFLSTDFYKALIGAAIATAVSAALYFGYQAWAQHYVNKGAQQERSVWQSKEDKRQKAETQARLAAEQKARAEETRKAKENDRVAQEQALREAQLRAAADMAHRRLGSLQHTIHALNERDRRRAMSAQSDAVALADEAARARGLLGQCSGRYAAVAASASEHAAQVIGLQDYIVAVNPDAQPLPAAEEPAK